VGQFTLFAAEVDDVTVIGSDSETGAQYVARWPSGQEYLRRRPPRPASGRRNRCAVCSASA